MTSARLTSTTLRRLSPRLVSSAGLALLWGASAALLAVGFSARIRDWAVMTDELQYVKLALSVAETHSPLPSIHGTSVSVANQLYPLVLAPVVGSFASTDAFRAAHVVNAVVMTSAVIPAYLLGRQLLPRGWSLGVAALCVITPWLVLTGFLMSETVAYPAFLWAVLAMQRTLVAPTPGRDLAAAIALGVALLARTQFAALALVLPLAILAHELGRARADSRVGGIRGQLRIGARSAITRHRALVACYALAATAGVVALLAGHSVFGAYATTVEGGRILPAGVWWSAVEHLAVVGIGCGLVPLLLGGGWMLVGVARPQTRDGAFATLALLTVAALAIETASFDLRFGGSDIVRDRYLFYVVPLLLLGSAVALREPPRLALAAGTGAVTALVVAAVPGLPFPTFPGLSVDSPVSILNEALIDHSGTLGVRWFVALTVLLLAVVLLLGLSFVPSAPLAAALFTTMLVFSTLMLRSEADRVLDSTSLSQRPLAGPPGVVLDWVDQVVPPGETAAIVPFPVSTDWGASAIRWWDVEFWNRTITRGFVVRDGNFTYTNFPLGTLQIDPASGAIAGTSRAPAYVVVAPGDSRLGLAGRVHAENAGLRVLAVDRPYRAAWVSSGLRTDGWTTPGRPASIRVYARPGAPREVQRVTITLQAPARSDAGYRISTETVDRPGAVPAGSSAEENVLACVGPGSPVDVTITSSTSALVDGPPLQPVLGPKRRVGVGLGGVQVQPTGRRCD